ncbi:MAG: class I SAM-dependent methyltransferase [Solirubrobacteraceae bacterium]|nr:MAG: SAM-dependent methyltransferase [Solirubrobacterales bacterium]
MSITTDGPPQQAGQEIRNPFFARLYHHVLQRDTSAKDLACRRELLADLAGTVVEVGPGNGPNFAVYGEGVERVIAVEPEPYLRKKAAAAAARAAVEIQVVAGDGEHLPLADGSVDAVVLALVLCSVPDQARTLSEARRVLRPGGEVRVYEHVVAERPVPRALQRAAQATFWPRALGNCHPARDTLQALRDAGFDTADVHRFVMQVAPVEPPMPYILGRSVAQP